MIYLVAYLVTVLLILMFMAGAKRSSYTPAEIAAEYDLQYRQLNGLA